MAFLGDWSRPSRRQCRRTPASPRIAKFELELLEPRLMPSFLDGNGAVILSLAEQNNGNELVITFDGPLDASPTDPDQDPTNIANYSIEIPGANAQMVTTHTGTVGITSASYDADTNSVTLELASALVQGQSYRVFVNGTSSLGDPAHAGLIDASGNQIDGDYDDTATGNFYALFAWAQSGTTVEYTNFDGADVGLAIVGDGELNTWRSLIGEFNAGDLAAQANLAGGLTVNQISIADGNADTTVLTGFALFEPDSAHTVIIPPTIPGIYTDALPGYFVTSVPTVTPPPPHVATANNLPYTIQIDPVDLPGLPELQSPVASQDNVDGAYKGYWLLFGGRTNGLHTFNPSNNFPPEDENQTIYVVNPTTGQVWSLDWADTDVPVGMLPPLYSTNQQSFQEGDKLYTIGGYGAEQLTPETFANYTTYDTLTALSVDGMINAVINGGSVASLSQIQQTSDPKFKVTGGELSMLNGLAYLVVGQTFEGQYNPGSTSGFSQTYTDAIQTFHINYDGSSLSVSDLQTQIDQTNLRRRDYNLTSVITPDGDPALMIYGGVFTPGPITLSTSNAGYRNPVLITGVGETKVLPFEQAFSQYSSPRIGLYSEGDGTMNTIFLGGISLYNVDFATGELILPLANIPPTLPALPFVNTVTTVVTLPDGTMQELEMPSQLPGLYGAEARFFKNLSLAHEANGVIDLDQLLLGGPVVLGYMYGGIESTAAQTTNQATQTKATNAVFKITLVPNINNASNETFVNSLSQVLLGHQATPEMEAYWVHRLDRGMSRERVSTAFIKLPEHRLLELQDYFVQFLNTSLDPVSQKYYMRLYARGATDQEVIAHILNSPAFRTTAEATGNGGNEAIVVTMYTDLFNRPPTDEEQAFWTNRLDNGMKLKTMIRALLKSEEYREDLVTNAFTIYLGRSPTEHEEANWSRALGHMPSQRFLARLFASGEYFYNHPGAS